MTDNCNGRCVTAADIGVGTFLQIAYPHPMCPEHGDDPMHDYREVRIHELHTGPDRKSNV